jgi:hypothetical protein
MNIDAINITLPSSEKFSREFISIYSPVTWLNGTPIHCFLTTLSISDLHSDIKLMEDIPGVERWGFEALFQRVLNKQRVQREIVRGFLKNDNRVKFFPPVTIALLPAEHNRPQQTYGKSVLDKTVASGDRHHWKLDGLSINWLIPYPPGSVPEHGHPSQIKWSHSKFIAVAIDGQHRIAALREFIGEHDQDASLKDIAATIMVFDPKLILGRTILQATREIFVDVNSRAKPVDQSRLILLNDQDACSDVTRRLISDSFDESGQLSRIEYAPLGDEFKFEMLTGIPQEMVNITAGKESSDTTKLSPWQFTSAFIIHRVVRQFMLLNRWREFEELLALRAIQSKGPESPEQAIIDRRSLFDSDDPDETDQVWIPGDDMFSFQPTVADWVADRFYLMWGALLRGVFTAFSPYKKLIEQFQNTCADAGQDSFLMRSLLVGEATAKDGFEHKDFNSATWKVLKDSDPKKAEAVFDRISGIKRPANWEKTDISWLSVTQRGLLFEPRMLRRAMEAARGQEYDSREAFAVDYVTQLNALHRDRWFERTFVVEEKSVWGGIILSFNPEGAPNVDPSDGAAKRLGQFLRLLIAVRLAGEWKPDFEARQGLKGPFGKVLEGYRKYLLATDPNMPEAEQYSAARKRLYAVLNRAKPASQAPPTI